MVAEVINVDHEQARQMMQTHGSAEAAITASLQGEMAPQGSHSEEIHLGSASESEMPLGQNVTEENDSGNAYKVPQATPVSDLEPVDPMMETAAAVYRGMSQEDKRRWADLQNASKGEKMKAFMDMDPNSRALVSSFVCVSHCDSIHAGACYGS